VIGLGDLGFSRDLQPPLTTVRIDGAVIGSTAARFIIARSEGKSVAEPICDIGFTIIERASV
jgi:LacI family gluconate utilization system Gnt-I transcriptional repressor